MDPINHAVRTLRMLTAAAAVLLCHAAAARAVTGGNPESLTGVRADRMVMPASLASALARIHEKVPAFSRQTGLACSACHSQFPQLTPFGRQFKLNGYTLTGLQTIGQPGDSAGKESLKLLPIPPLSAMVVGSVTSTSASQPGTQNGTAQFPQQLSLFAAGAISPNLGAFTQVTYAPGAGTFGIDNIDVRYATHTTMGDRDVLLGLTLHNNPTVQDVWNTVPAWSFPFMSSTVAPSPMASTLVEGALAQQVIGLGAYTMLDNTLYGEFSAYRSAPSTGAQPIDSSGVNTIRDIAPYWRVALQHSDENTYVMLGTFGMDAHVYPTGISGYANHFTDAAIDAQVEQKVGTAMLIGRAAFIHENQQLTAFQLADAPTAAIGDHTLSTFKASVAYQPSLRYAFTGGYFNTNGTSDALLYAPGALTGSNSGSPNAAGLIGEFNFNAWQNARVGLQYVVYSKFNGASTAYDVAGGRNASDNNTLYIYTWFAF